MLNLNFIPWRRERRKHEIKHISLLFGISFALPVISLMLVYHILKFQQEKILAQMEIDNEELDSYAHLIEDNQNSGQFQQLQNEIEIFRNIITLLEKTPTDRICLTGLTQKTEKIKLSGISRSMIDLMYLMNEWKKSNLISEITYTKISQTNNNNIQFNVQMIEKNRTQK